MTSSISTRVGSECFLDLCFVFDFSQSQVSMCFAGIKDKENAMSLSGTESVIQCNTDKNDHFIRGKPCKILGVFSACFGLSTWIELLRF